MSIQKTRDRNLYPVPMPKGQHPWREDPSEIRESRFRPSWMKIDEWCRYHQDIRNRSQAAYA